MSKNSHTGTCNFKKFWVDGRSFTRATGRQGEKEKERQKVENNG